MSDHYIFIIEFVLRELLNNAVEHGNKLIADCMIKYCLFYTNKEICIQVTDEGEGFEIDILGSLRQSSILRLRNRGLPAIEEMGFILKVSNSTVTAVRKLDEDWTNNERKFSSMEVRFEDKTAMCTIYKNLIAVNVTEMVEQLKHALEENNEFDFLTIDLSKTSSIDSLGITFLVGVYKTMESDGKRTRLRGVSTEMNQLFKIMRLDDIFEIDRS